MSTINTIFPFIQEEFDKETFLIGEYSSKLTSSEYRLLNWKGNTYVIEDTESSHIDAVFPPHPESAYLTSLIPNREKIHGKNEGSFLDVGVGSGILTIDAAKKGWRTTGVDINPKALRVASINAALNYAQCQFQEDDLARGQQAGSFDFCVANLPFEPTPENRQNFIHSDGGKYGDKLIIDFIPIIEKKIKIDGYVILPSFSLLKNNESRLEKHFKEIDESSFIRSIIRLSKPLKLALLSYRFKDRKNAYDYLTAEGYSHFVIDIGLLKKTKDESSFIGILNKSSVADKSWIMPLVQRSFITVQ